MEITFPLTRAVREAVTLALMHKHLYEYVRDTSRQLDALIREMKTDPGTGLLPSAAREP